MVLIHHTALSYLTKHQIKKLNDKYGINLYDYDNIYDIELDLKKRDSFVSLFEEIEEKAFTPPFVFENWYEKEDVLKLLNEKCILIDNMEFFIKKPEEIEEWKTEERIEHD